MAPAAMAPGLDYFRTELHFCIWEGGRDGPLGVGTPWMEHVPHAAGQRFVVSATYSPVVHHPYDLSVAQSYEDDDHAVALLSSLHPAGSNRASRHHSDSRESK